MTSRLPYSSSRAWLTMMMILPAEHNTHETENELHNAAKCYSTINEETIQRKRIVNHNFSPVKQLGYMDINLELDNHPDMTTRSKRYQVSILNTEIDVGSNPWTPLNRVWMHPIRRSSTRAWVCLCTLASNKRLEDLIHDWDAQLTLLTLRLLTKA